MQFKESQGYCANCRTSVLVRRRQVDHTLHAVLCLATASFWLAVWIALAVIDYVSAARNISTWYCSRCGGYIPVKDVYAGRKSAE